MRSRRAYAVLIAVASAVVAAGCGDGGDDAGPADGDSAAVSPTQTEPAVGGGGGGVRLQKVGDFDRPLYVTQPPGSADLYVVEQPGRIRIVRDGETVSAPALDISDQVSDEGEQGLLSLAFAPDFQSSRLAYVYFTGSDQDQHVVEFETAGDGTLDEGSRRELLKMDDFASNHNGGLLLFGLDRRLYIGTGDGGGGFDPERNGQDLGSLLGKILRIDPRPSGGDPYRIPSDNPFVGVSGARPEIYAYGLRNPWRFDFDPKTGALVIADVGQSEFEEVDYVDRGRGAGANFGWSAFEGPIRANEDESAPNHVPPVFSYGRDRGCSITGGYVVRDRGLPTLYGRYLYGDFCVSDLRSFVPSTQRARDDRSLGLDVSELSSFGRDTRSRIYATSLDGPVYRLVAE
jgi:glucose/arabinose dehydrogenase